MSKQTAMQQLKDFCEYRLRKATNENKSAWNMILAKIKDDELIEMEKQQIIDFTNNYYDCDNDLSVEQFYNKTFNK